MRVPDSFSGNQMIQGEKGVVKSSHGPRFMRPVAPPVLVVKLAHGPDYRSQEL
jgi:hypothetical protein